MKTTHDSDHFFETLSKFIFLIPVGAIILGLLIKFSGPATLTYKSMMSPTPIPQYSISPQPTQNIASNSPQLDLVGPYMCKYQDVSNDVIAYIKDKNIYIEYSSSGKQEKILVKGDCAYQWIGFGGDKMCGVSQYLGLLDMMTAFGGGMSLDTIFKMLPQGTTSSNNQNLAANVAKTCKKQAVSDAVFTVPTNVLFKNGDLLQSLGGSK